MSTEKNTNGTRRVVSNYTIFTLCLQWRRIQNALQYNGQTVKDRPDLCVRIFQRKKAEIMKDLKKNNISATSIVEFQKRGSPILHIIIESSSKSSKSEV